MSLSAIYEEIFGSKVELPGQEMQELDKKAAASVEAFEEFDSMGRLMARQYAASALSHTFNLG